MPLEPAQFQPKPPSKWLDSKQEPSKTKTPKIPNNLWEDDPNCPSFCPPLPKNQQYKCCLAPNFEKFSPPDRIHLSMWKQTFIGRETEGMFGDKPEREKPAKEKPEKQEKDVENRLLLKGGFDKGPYGGFEYERKWKSGGCTLVKE